MEAAIAAHQWLELLGVWQEGRVVQYILRISSVRCSDVMERVDELL
jgi:hypothetical protein